MASGLMSPPDQSVKLLMLSHYFEGRRGGIEIVAAALARELTSLGFGLVWLATGEANHGGEPDRYRRGSLAASSVAEKLLRIPYPILYPSAWRRIFRETARNDVILVHDALYMTSIIAYLAARANRKPLVVVQHVGFVPYASPLVRNLMKVANRCVAAPILRRADKVIFVSQLTMRHFADIRWQRTPALVFNGVDTDIFSPALEGSQASARRSLGLPVDVSIALFVGRFVEKKGLHVLERMARMRSDLLFAFAGHGPLDPERWGLPNVRIYAGLSGSTLATLYRASDVLLLPSAGEGFPLVMQEALACGLAIICGIETAGADSRATPFLKGVEVDPGDPDRTAHLFSEEITRVLAHPETETGRRERFEFAKTRYSWAASCATYASILGGVRMDQAR